MDGELNGLQQLEIGYIFLLLKREEGVSASGVNYSIIFINFVVFKILFKSNANVFNEMKIVNGACILKCEYLYLAQQHQHMFY